MFSVPCIVVNLFSVETNKCALAKMFRYTFLFVIPPRFSQSCDRLLGVVQSEYKQYTSDCIKMREKNTPGFYQLMSVSPAF